MFGDRVPRSAVWAGKAVEMCSAGAGAAVPGSRAPGRPRSERASQAILRAAVDLLLEGVPVEALSTEAVVARAGVGKATLYRRWPNKEAVLRDVLESLTEAPVRPPGADLREDLVVLVHELCRWLVESRSGRLLPRLLGTPELYARYVHLVIEPRVSAIRDVLCAGVRCGALAPHSQTEMLLTMLTGPVLSRVVLCSAVPGSPDDLRDDRFAARLVDHVLAGHVIARNQLS